MLNKNKKIIFLDLITAAVLVKVYPIFKSSLNADLLGRTGEAGTFGIYFMSCSSHFSQSVNISKFYFKISNLKII